MAEIEKSKQNSWVKFCSDINGVIAMAKVHKLMAKDSSNSPGVLRRPNDELTTSHEESAKVLLDAHFPGSVLFGARGLIQSLNNVTQAEARVGHLDI